MKKKINKEELRKRCEGIANQTVTRRVDRLTNDKMYKMLRSYGLMSMAPIIGYTTSRPRRGNGLTKIFKIYMKYLVEESLKYPIDIYIPKIGILKVLEIDSIGKKKHWNEDGKLKHRFDTPFNKTVMYRIYHQIFGIEINSFKTPFKLSRTFVSPIVGQIYKNHPNGGFYAKYKQTRK